MATPFSEIDSTFITPIHRCPLRCGQNTQGFERRNQLSDRGSSLTINDRTAKWFRKHGSFSPGTEKQPLLPQREIEDPHAVPRGDEEPAAAPAAGQRMVVTGPVAGGSGGDQPVFALGRLRGGRRGLAGHAAVEEGVGQRQRLVDEYLLLRLAGIEIRQRKARGWRFRTLRDRSWGLLQGRLQIGRGSESAYVPRWRTRSGAPEATGASSPSRTGPISSSGRSAVHIASGASTGPSVTR